MLLRSPRTELFKSTEFYSEDGLKMVICQCHWYETLHVHSSGLLEYRVFQVSRGSTQKVAWNVCLSVTLGKRLCTIIVHIFREAGLFTFIGKYSGNILKWQATQWRNLGERICKVTIKIFQDRVLWNSRVLFGIWSWNFHTLGVLVKSLFNDCLGLLVHKTLRDCKVVPKRWSWNGRILNHDNRKDSAQSLLIHIVVLICISWCAAS